MPQDVAAGAADEDVQRDPVPAAVAGDGVHQVLPALRHRHPDPRGEVCVRAAAGPAAHGHRGQPVPPAHAPGQAHVQHPRLPARMDLLQLVFRKSCSRLIFDRQESAGL